MKLSFVEPTDGKHYWWLPEFILKEIRAGRKQKPSDWSIRFCSASEPVGYVGAFYGPIEEPNVELDQ